MAPSSVVGIVQAVGERALDQVSGHRYLPRARRTAGRSVDHQSARAASAHIGSATQLARDALPMSAAGRARQPTAARSRARRTASEREDAPQLREDGRHVVPDGLLGQVQASGDLGVAQALVEQVEHLDLAVGEPTDVGPGAGPRAARDPRADRPQLGRRMRSTSTAAPSSVEQRSRLAEVDLVVAVEQRPRRVVGHAGASPELLDASRCRPVIDSTSGSRSPSGGASIRPARQTSSVSSGSELRVAEPDRLLVPRERPRAAPPRGRPPAGAPRRGPSGDEALVVRASWDFADVARAPRRGRPTRRRGRHVGPRADRWP